MFDLAHPPHITPVNPISPLPEEPYQPSPSFSAPKPSRSQQFKKYGPLAGIALVGLIAVTSAVGVSFFNRSTDDRSQASQPKTSRMMLSQGQSKEGTTTYIVTADNRFQAQGVRYTRFKATVELTPETYQGSTLQQNSVLGETDEATDDQLAQSTLPGFGNKTTTVRVGTTQPPNRPEIQPNLAVEPPLPPITEADKLDIAKRCYNQVIVVDKTPYWPNSCHGLETTGSCAQVLTKLTKSETNRYALWKKGGLNLQKRCGWVPPTSVPSPSPDNTKTILTSDENFIVTSNIAHLLSKVEYSIIGIPSGYKIVIDAKIANISDKDIQNILAGRNEFFTIQPVNSQFTYKAVLTEASIKGFTPLRPGEEVELISATGGPITGPNPYGAGGSNGIDPDNVGKASMTPRPLPSSSSRPRPTSTTNIPSSGTGSSNGSTGGNFGSGAGIRPGTGTTPLINQPIQQAQPR